MSLSQQVHIYSLGTDAFYTDQENEIYMQKRELEQHKSRLEQEKDVLTAYFSGKLSEDKAQKQYRAIYRLDKDAAVTLGGLDHISKLKVEIKSIGKAIKLLDANFATLLNSHSGTRVLRVDHLRDWNVISLFESTLTRTLMMKTGNLYTDLIVVRCYYYAIMRDLVLNGFTYNGEQYICFTASAGQIRTKKAYFVKKSVLQKHQNTLMCGLTPEEINSKGGININKYLAYLALCSTATDPWDDFDIDKAIVVNDFETNVTDEVDYISPKTFRIERKVMNVPICHTDGCGLILPQCCAGNMQVRLPFVKGLLAAFPFDKFIRDADKREPGINHGLVTDIYGTTHDVLAEEIEVIFTKSQFKMNQYFKDWNDYKRRFKENNCAAGKCGEERNYIPNSVLSYQIFQSLTDVSDEELYCLATPAINKITNIATNRESMLEAFGAADDDEDKNGFQQCLNLYPELLADGYSRERLKAIKKKLVTQARAGKLPVDSKYMFLIPDLYAFCEWLFLGIKNPRGLLQDGEVSAYLYRNIEKLDCLRSPHLYREHAIRKNVVNAQTKKWFSKKAIYTSCHDLISKILQFDVDGDTSLVVADPLLIAVAERNMQGIVPLYYEMGKAAPTQITNENIYTAMRSAWKFGNIGKYSNVISRLWNSDCPDINLIKIETALNNFSIDAAKTNLMPQLPADIELILQQVESKKLPHFFKYAKGKTDEQIAPTNRSTVNRLESIVPNKRMTFSARNIGKFDYKYLLSNRHAKIKVDQAVINLYLTSERRYQYAFRYDKADDTNNFAYLCDTIQRDLMDLGYTLPEIVDMLVKSLFKDKPRNGKTVFWACFGNIILENLKRNLPANSKQCVKCGKRFVPSAPNQRLCKACGTYKPVKKRKEARTAKTTRRKKAKKKAA